MLKIITGAVLVFISNYILSSLKFYNDKKTLKQQMISNNIAPMRQAWINDLRDNISSYIYISMSIDALIYRIINACNNNNEDLRLKLNKKLSRKISELNKIKIQIDLLLPFKTFKKREHNAEALRSFSNFICIQYDNVVNDPINVISHNRKIRTLRTYYIHFSKKMLKQEWDATKIIYE